MSVVLLIVVALVVYLGVAVLVGHRLRVAHRALSDLLRPGGTLHSGGTPVLELDKDFDLVPQHASVGYPTAQKASARSLPRDSAVKSPQPSQPPRQANVFRPVTVAAGALDEDDLALFRSKRTVGPLTRALNVVGETQKDREQSNFSGIGLSGGKVPIFLK